MRTFVFLLIVCSVVAFASSNTSNPSANYILNDFTVRALSSSMVFDQTKKFSIGLGYKQFGGENYFLAGFRLSRWDVLGSKVSGYLNVIVPVRYLYEDDFWSRWWQRVWLDAWVYWSF